MDAETLKKLLKDDPHLKNHVYLRDMADILNLEVDIFEQRIKEGHVNHLKTGSDERKQAMNNLTSNFFAMLNVLKHLCYPIAFEGSKESKKKNIMILGNIGAGKSSLANKIQMFLENGGKPVVGFDGHFDERRGL